MDKYDQEIFNFLTSGENFEAMLKVNGHFGMVKENLLKGFWNQVALKLEEKLKEFADKWKVFKPRNMERNDAKLIIYKSEWIQNDDHPFVGVAWEHLFTNTYYGVWVNMKSPSIDFTKLRSSFEDLRVRLNYRVDQAWWPLWQNGNYNFSIPDNISKILPDVLENAIEEYAYNLIHLLPEVERFIDDALTPPA